MLRSTQRFTYQLKNRELENDSVFFLLMPNEVEEIKTYLTNFPEKSLADAFQRFTGKGNMENITNVKLEVIYY